jgi:phage baseplate assembly protein W
MAITDTRGLGFYDKEFLTVKSGMDIISESITQILMTNPGERVGRPFFGVGLSRLLFEPMDQVTVDSLQQQIVEQIQSYEPRADLTGVNVEFDEESNSIYVKIGFRRKNDVNGEERFLNFGFELEG